MKNYFKNIKTEQEKRYKVIAKYDDGCILTYMYEGDCEYNGKMETARERAVRHMKNKHIISYEIIESYKNKACNNL